VVVTPSTTTASLSWYLVLAINLPTPLGN
jgi:hypothetical protein